MSNTKLLESKIMYCSHISDSDDDLKDIADFEVRYPEISKGLKNYLQYSAVYDEFSGRMRTYLVRDIETDELVGYFSLKAGMVSLNEHEDKDEVTGETVNLFDTVPGIELANFAVNGDYIDRHSSRTGIGLLIFREFIQFIVNEASKIIGAGILYIFALPEEKLIRNYAAKYQFLRLDEQSEKALHSRLKPKYDESCIFMYQLI